MRKLKIALIGAGLQGTNNLLPALMQIPEAQVVAICCLDKARAKQVAETYSVKNNTTDYKKLITTGIVDTVVVACPPQIHYEVAKLSIENNLNVFVEKPPAVSTEELELLIKLAKKHKSITAVGLNFRYAQPYQKLLNIVRNTNFGKPIYINLRHLANKPKSPLWGLSSTIRSFLLAQAIHPIDLLLNLGGEVIDRNVNIVNFRDSLIVNLCFTFKNNLVGSLTTGNLFPHFDSTIEIISDKSNQVKLDSLWNLQLVNPEMETALIPETKRWSLNWNPSPLNSGYERSGYLGELTEFVKAISTNSSFSPSFNDLVPTYKTIDFIEKKYLSVYK